MAAKKKALLFLVALAALALPTAASIPPRSELVRALEAHAAGTTSAAETPQTTEARLPLRSTPGRFRLFPRLETHVRVNDFSLPTQPQRHQLFSPEIAVGVWETGLYYAKARFYDPVTGRFLTEDPVEGQVDTPPSLHRYLYAFGNPTVFVDPSGEFAVSTAVLVAAAIAGGFLAAEPANAPESDETLLIEREDAGGTLAGSLKGLTVVASIRVALAALLGEELAPETVPCAGPCDDLGRRRAVTPGTDRPEAGREFGPANSSFERRPPLRRAGDEDLTPVKGDIVHEGQDKESQKNKFLFELGEAISGLNLGEDELKPPKR